MILRPATTDDAETLFAWRNDPETRANSVNSKPVPWNDHFDWLMASIANPNRDLLVAEVEGAPVGTVRLDRGEETELSWTVGRHYRGKGVGKQMVQLACPNGPTIAKIKATNIASQRIAEFAGFKLVEDGDLQLWKR